MQCRIESSRAHGAHVVAISGVIDLGALPACRSALTAGATDPDAALLVVDLDGTTVLDDAALGLVIGAAARLRATGRALVVVCADLRLRGLLADTGVDGIVPVVGSVREALATPGCRAPTLGDPTTAPPMVRR